MPLVENDTLCPVCSRPMRVLTILRRVQGKETHVLQCKPCGLSTTKTVDALPSTAMNVRRFIEPNSVSSAVGAARF